MAKNELYKSVVAENARFVSKQDTAMFVPKARGSKRYGLVLYNINDFIIDASGRLRLALPQVELRQLYKEIYGTSRENTVLADPAINLSTLAQRDIELDQKIDEEVSKVEGAWTSEITRLDERVDDETSSRVQKDTQLEDKIDNEISERESEIARVDGRIDGIISDDTVASINKTYSSLKITNLIESAKLQGLHFGGFIGKVVGEDLHGDPVIGSKGDIWYQSEELSKPATPPWTDDVYYCDENEEWVEYVGSYIPKDFSVWSNLNVEEEEENTWFYLHGKYDSLDFRVDLSLYYTKGDVDTYFKSKEEFDEDIEDYYTKLEVDDEFKTKAAFDTDMLDYYDKYEADMLFKPDFEYGDYLSETNDVLNIDNLNMPTSGELTSFDNEGTELDTDNVEGAIKLLDLRSTLELITEDPSRQGDFGVGANGVYKSIVDEENEGLYKWQLVTKDLSILLEKSRANYDFVTSLSFVNDSSTGYLSATSTTRNIDTSETKSINLSIPVATSSIDGIMPATAMVALGNLNIRLTALESGVQSYFVDFGSNTPTQEFLEDLYLTVSSGVPLNLTRMIDLVRNLYVEWNAINVHWDGPYTYRYGIGEVGLPGLVSSSESNGQIYIEPVTGVMSLNGYSDLAGKFLAETGQLKLVYVPDMSANKITSDTFSLDRIPLITIAKGGTGLSTLAQNRLVFTGDADNEPMRTGAEFGALDTILASAGIGLLPIFKTKSALGLFEKTGGTITGETIISSNTILKLFELKNQTAASYARMLFTGDQKQYTLGVGNSNAAITALKNKFYAYDFTTSTPIMYGDKDKMQFSGKVGVADAVDDDDAVNKKQLDDKVDKVSGKQLSTNDYTTPEKTKLNYLKDNIESVKPNIYNAGTVKTWNGLTDFYGEYIWTDGDNIYYSRDANHYVLDKATSTWTAKVWNGLTSFRGDYIWSDGDNIYCSNNANQYVLDKSTSTWITKTWNGLTNFNGNYIWTDGDNIYYSRDANQNLGITGIQLVLNKATSTWTTKTWSGLTDFPGNYIWSDGTNIYYSRDANHYVIDKATSTWITKTWNGLTSFGYNIWSDGDNIYYSSGVNQYVLNKATSTWTYKSWNGFTNLYGHNIWSDGDNIYYSNGTTQYTIIANTSVKPKYKNSAYGKANDSSVVKLTGNQTVAGVKTFSSTIVGSISGNATTASGCGKLIGTDTRNVNTLPNGYFSYAIGFVSEFKTSSVIGLSDTYYCLLLTNVPWGDASGGLPSQVAYMSNGEKYNRDATSATTWGAWRKEINSGNLVDALAALGTV